MGTRLFCLFCAEALCYSSASSDWSPYHVGGEQACERILVFVGPAGFCFCATKQAILSCHDALLL